MSELENTSLPEWAVGELQRPVQGTAEQRMRIMEMVRAAERPRRRTTAAYYPRSGNRLGENHRPSQKTRRC